MKKGTITVIYGPGHGKSAAAVGYGMIEASKGAKVIIVQFLKGILEEKGAGFLKRMEPDMKVFRFERSKGFFENLPEEEKKEEMFNLKNGFHFARKVLMTGECDVLILDEVLGLVDQGVISKEEFLQFLDSADGEMNLVLTGRVCPEEIKQHASCVSYVENIKVDGCLE